jgi:phage tail tape-measure protein
MRRAFVVASLMLSLGAAPNFANANEQGAVAGAVTGAAAGAVVGGPVGAAVGAVLGGITGGAASGPNQGTAQAQGGSPVPTQPANLPPAGPQTGALGNEPETTGSVVMERTCARDAQGAVTCRRVR